MQINRYSRIAVIGAGITGLTTAFMLSGQGYSVTVYEADDRVRGIGAGMGLASNAITAFTQLGLGEAVKNISFPLKSFYIYDDKGRKLFSIEVQKMARNLQNENFAVHRTDLHQLLQTQNEQLRIHTGKRLVNLTMDTEKVGVQFDDGSHSSFDFVIGADGVNSKVRQSLLPKAVPRYAGYWCWRQVITNPGIALEGSRAYWGKWGRFGLTPLSQNRLYWFACHNAPLTGSTQTEGLKKLKQYFDDYAHPIPLILEQSNDRNLISAPVMDIAPLKKFYFHRVLLMGDAAHATTPNMGQGACMAVEDVAVLKDELGRNAWATTCKNFEKRRLDRTRYIIKNSRLAGQIAQVENGALIRLRNAIFRYLPRQLTQRPLKRLLKEDFRTV